MDWFVAFVLSKSASKSIRLTADFVLALNSIRRSKKDFFPFKCISNVSNSVWYTVKKIHLNWKEKNNLMWFKIELVKKKTKKNQFGELVFMSFASFYTSDVVTASLIPVLMVEVTTQLLCYTCIQYTQIYTCSINDN